MFDFALIPGLGTRGILIAKGLSNLLSVGVGLAFIARSVGTSSMLVFLGRLIPVGTVLCVASLTVLTYIPSVFLAAACMGAFSVVLAAVSRMITMAEVTLFTSMARRVIPRRAPQSTAQE
jgi:hypothetical protein